MIKLNKTQIAGLNNLTVFETAEDRFGRSQAEVFRTDCVRLRKWVAFVITTTGEATGAKRDKILRDLGLGWLATHSKKRDILSAWAKFAGPMGDEIVKKAKARKLGKCSTIRGAVASHETDIKPKATRKPKSGQGKKTVNFKAEKGGKATTIVEGLIHSKTPTTVAGKLELLEAFCTEKGFSFIDFIAEWNAEANEGNATLTGKIAANG